MQNKKATSSDLAHLMLSACSASVQPACLHASLPVCQFILIFFVDGTVHELISGAQSAYSLGGGFDQEPSQCLAISHEIFMLTMAP